MARATPTYTLIHTFSMDTSIFSYLQVQKIDLLLKLWQIVLLNQSLLVLADSPTISRPSHQRDGLFPDQSNLSHRTQRLLQSLFHHFRPDVQ
jgi:hypothetical protein